MTAKKKTAILLSAGALLTLGWFTGRSARIEAPAPVAHPEHHEHQPSAGRPAFVPAAPRAMAASAAPTVKAADAEATPGLLPPPRFHPRAAEEWQGMKVDLSLQPPCMESFHCGQAMACNVAEHRCGPCEVDADCGSGEACVLDHCVLDSNVSCRHRADCGEDALCVLSGLSAGVRGNAEMRAYCQSNTLGTPEEAPTAEHDSSATHPAEPQEHPTVYGGALLESLRAEADAEP
ncbi:MAG: hypothetical protein H6730_24360 [Deltaproteobacteria bacterium]|nr:hypothetical protein [Deltaproteobacteria bacterium]